ncbi:hypothetical protein GCM10011348_39950 [Marinobacterium nitratireducens]|uniref:Secreted protein n=1 Tax=Marinobacterium nitratireducens TaxID=518897 RepID=A0A918DXI2_9GAMM|nr:hypothetical protein [Marinobacterium nitratireducens]GGO87235.1 hypothetical protein GCM10011348_39950 [Marinobacterium nitratireducens]
MSRKILCLSTLVALGLPLAAQADDSANGVDGAAAGAAIAGPAFIGPIDTQINGPWLEFSFGAAGSVGPCVTCVPSSGGNSVYLVDPPEWTFTLPFGGGTLTVTDAFDYGDQFEVFDHNVSLGLTPLVPVGGNCGSDPEVCLPDPASSSRVYPLAGGDHSIGLNVTVSPFGGGAAYFRVDTADVAEVDIDIKFCSDPNAFNQKKKGGLPVTIFGNGVDVADIDVDTLQLCTDAAGTDCTAPGVHSYSIADRGDPSSDLGAASCAIDPATGEELHTLNPDGYDDLDAVFYAPDVATLLDSTYGPLVKGDEVGPLYLVGYLYDDTPITSVPVNSVGVDMLLIQR